MVDEKFPSVTSRTSYAFWTEINTNLALLAFFLSTRNAPLAIDHFEASDNLSTKKRFFCISAEVEWRKTPILFYDFSAG